MENARAMNTRPNDNTLNFIFSRISSSFFVSLTQFRCPLTPAPSCVRISFMYIVNSKSWKSWKSANRCHKMKLMWFARDVRSSICFVPFFFSFFFHFVFRSAFCVVFNFSRLVRASTHTRQATHKLLTALLPHAATQYPDPLRTFESKLPLDYHNEVTVEERNLSLVFIIFNLLWLLSTGVIYGVITGEHLSVVVCIWFFLFSVSLFLISSHLTRWIRRRWNAEMRLWCETK